MERENGISLIKLVVIIVVAIIAIYVIALGIFNLIKNNQADIDKNDSSTSLSEKEDEIIQNIRNVFTTLREEVIINVATIDGYQPNNTNDGTAFDLKNIVVSELGENAIDESNSTISEVDLETFKKAEGEIIELTDGYHVYLSNGKTDDEKYITIVYKDSTFNHGMAYYDTENNIVSDKSDGTYPILVAQFRLNTDDISYYLEPIKSVN